MASRPLRDHTFDTMAAAFAVGVPDMAQLLARSRAPVTLAGVNMTR
jgi:hypothetical protein